MRVPLAGQDFQPQQPVYEAPDPTPTESDEAGNSCVNFLRIHKRIIIACLIIIIFLSFGVYGFLLAIRPTGNTSTIGVPAIWGLEFSMAQKKCEKCQLGEEPVEGQKFKPWTDHFFQSCRR